MSDKISPGTPETDHARILRLEERLAWFEKHVIEQDRVMLDISEQLTRVKSDLRSVREKAESGETGGVEQKEAPPPHY